MDPVSGVPVHKFLSLIPENNSRKFPMGTPLKQHPRRQWAVGLCSSWIDHKCRGILSILALVTKNGVLIEIMI